ncbi:hypothetical protein ALMP_69880, partial [Streptomyces sp. A012304]
RPPAGGPTPHNNQENQS